MEAIVEEVVDPADLKKFQTMYYEQQQRGYVAENTQFQFAWCLVRSTHLDETRRGIALLEDLFKKTKDDHARRDYLYYLSLGNARAKEYEMALRYANAILEVQPGNHQAKNLHDYIKKKMRNEGLIGMAIVGGAAALAVGSIVGLALGLAKK